jgi:hypothetical protein
VNVGAGQASVNHHMIDVHKISLLQNGGKDPQYILIPSPLLLLSNKA